MYGLPDWVTHDAHLFEKYLAEFTGKPEIKALEIGAFEGRSAIWFMDHILTGTNSEITTIDVFTMEGLEDRFDRNIVASGHASQIKKIKGEILGGEIGRASCRERV